ncbi:hypothetical protein ACWDZ5_24165, partial [Streptomyces sp. NPDC002996]
AVPGAALLPAGYPRRFQAAGTGISSPTCRSRSGRRATGPTGSWTRSSWRPLRSTRGMNSAAGLTILVDTA